MLWSPVPRESDESGSGGARLARRTVEPAFVIALYVLAIVGVGSAFYTFGVVMEYLVAVRLADPTGRRKMEKHIEALKGHIILAGLAVGYSVAAHARWPWVGLLLLLPMVPGLGATINGARIWIRFAGFSFQPGEIAKIALALFFAGYLVTARDSLSMVGKKFLGVRWPQLKDLGPIFVVWLVAMMVLIFQRDMGTSLLYFGLFLVLMYVATGRAIWFVVGGGLFGTGALVASRFLTYVEGRFAAWLDSFNPTVYEAVGGSYQLVQGLFGFASGGIIGTGLGAGHPSIVPLAESDYIVASLGEELGLVGIFAILCLYLLFISRGMRIGINGADDFGRLLAVGLTFVIALQVFIVIGGVTRVIPVTGLTTPFLAAGGSSLVANWIIVALLLRLSDTVRHQREGGDAA